MAENLHGPGFDVLDHQHRTKHLEVTTEELRRCMAVLRRLCKTLSVTAMVEGEEGEAAPSLQNLTFELLCQMNAFASRIVELTAHELDLNAEALEATTIPPKGTPRH